MSRINYQKADFNQNLRFEEVNKVVNIILHNDLKKNNKEKDEEILYFSIIYKLNMHYLMKQFETLNSPNLIKETEIDSIKDELRSVNNEVCGLLKTNASAILKYEVYAYISEVMFYMQNVID